MNTQNLSGLQVFQSFFCKCKNLFLQSCPKEFMRFVCECKVNLLKRNLQNIKRQRVPNFLNDVWLPFLRRGIWRQRRDILASKKGSQLKKSLLFSSLVIFLDIEQFVLVPVSVCNKKSLSTPSVTKQKLPKYQFNQNPTYQIDSLRKEINKKLFAKAPFFSTKFCLVNAPSSQIRRL